MLYQQENKYFNGYYRFSILLGIITSLVIIFKPSIALYFSIAFLCVSALPIAVALLLAFVGLIVSGIHKLKGHDNA